MRPTRNLANFFRLSILSLAFTTLVTVDAMAREPASPIVPQKSNEQWWVDRHEKHVAQMKEGNVDLLMIGDSITHLWENTEGTIFKSYAHGANVWKKYYASRRAMNLGFAGDQTQNVLWRLDNLPLDKISPKVAVLLIGTNNLRGKRIGRVRKAHTPEQTVEGINAVVALMRKKQPNMKILLLGVFPRSKEANGRYRDSIAQVNQSIKKLDDGKNVFFLDIKEAFLEPDGTLPQTIAPDFLHLSEEGYKRWAEAIEPTVKKLLGK